MACCPSTTSARTTGIMCIGEIANVDKANWVSQFMTQAQAAQKVDEKTLTRIV